MKLTCLLLWILPAMACLAEEIQQDKLYSGGTYVESGQTGVGLTIPEGWQGAWPSGTEMFVLESAELKATIFMAFQQGDEAGLQALMSNNIPLDTNVQLVPESAPTKIDNTYTAEYSVAGAPQLSGYVAARILPGSLGVAFIALSADASTTSQVEQITLELASSLTVKQPSTPLAEDRSATKNGHNLWKDYFKGRYIVRNYSGSDYYESQELWLCSDSRFLKIFESGGYGMSGASGASSRRGEGYWTATGVTDGEGQLVLQFGAGSVSEISIPGADYSTSGPGGEQLVYQVVLDGKLYLDGKQWLRGKNEVCD